MARTSMGKTRPVDRPYAIFRAPGWEWRVLKAYGRDPHAPYARWYLSTSSPYVEGELGDGYAADVMANGQLTYRDPEVGEDEVPDGLVRTPLEQAFDRARAEAEADALG